jgi:hypothetical protein
MIKGVQEATLLAALVLATGCAGGSGTTEPQDGSEAALKTSNNKDTLLGTYEGPRVKIPEGMADLPDSPMYEGTLFLKVTKGDGITCSQYEFDMKIRLDSGKVIDADSTFEGKMENGRLEFYRTRSFDPCQPESRIGFDILANGDLRSRMDTRFNTDYGWTTRNAVALSEGAILKKK